MCVQHLVNTTSALFEILIRIGIKPHNIFVCGKQYSICSEVANKLKLNGIYVQNLSKLLSPGQYSEIFTQDLIQMWSIIEAVSNNAAFDQIIILDDGGKCLSSVPEKLKQRFPIIGIEQTTFGIFHYSTIKHTPPYINIATCAAKKFLEPHIIAEELCTCIFEKLPPPDKKIICGIAGYGNIGKNLAATLHERGYTVVVFDIQKLEAIKNYKFKKHHCIKTFIKKSHYIFGCTGHDITHHLNIEDFNSTDKVLISCSSEDIEFLSLLKLITSNRCEHKQTFKDIIYQHDNGNKLTILNNGFPVNFNTNNEIAKPQDIQLTRALLLAGIMQAILILNTKNHNTTRGEIMLSPILQKFLVQKWKSHNSFDKLNPIIDNFKNLDWIKQNSAGQYYDFNIANKFSFSYNNQENSVLTGQPSF